MIHREMLNIRRSATIRCAHRSCNKGSQRLPLQPTAL
jgi:hypothetical protein